MSNLSVTYKESAEKFLVELQEDGNAEAHEVFIEGVRAFAKYLDGFTVLDDKLQILAYQKAREIDREVMLKLAAQLPKEVVENIVREVNSKHIHKRKEYDGGKTDTTE